MTTHARKWPLVVAAALSIVALVGCTEGPADGTGDGPAGTRSDGTSSTTAPTGTITVFAAASLQQTFTTLGRRYEAAHPGTTIRFSFAGSSDLVEQIRNGAPADVFASADEANMAKLARTDLAGAPEDFASNVLEIAVAPGNPHRIERLGDLTGADLQLVTCAAPVPCGAVTARVERAAGVDLHPVSEEQSVTDVLGKVASGQADAGLVYATDVEGADGAVDGVPVDESAEAVTTYPIAVLRDSGNPALARAFAASVRSDAGQRVLAAAGFGKP